MPSPRPSGRSASYGLKDDYDLRPGGHYRGMPNDGMIAMGMSDVVVDGEVIEADPPRKLVVTWRMVIDPRMAAEGKPMSTYKGGVVVA